MFTAAGKSSPDATLNGFGKAGKHTTLLIVRTQTTAEGEGTHSFAMRRVCESKSPVLLLWTSTAIHTKGKATLSHKRSAVSFPWWQYKIIKWHWGNYQPTYKIWYCFANKCNSLLCIIWLSHSTWIDTLRYTECVSVCVIVFVLMWVCLCGGESVCVCVDTRCTW